MRATRQLKISEAARDVLKRSTVETGTTMGWLLKLPEGQLDRKLYEEVNKILTSWNGKWSRKHAGHVFASDPSPLLLAEDGVEDKKWSLQQFWTPPEVAKQVVDLADIGRAGCLRILEPSAGFGALINLCYEQNEDVEALCVEKDPDLADTLAAKGDGYVTVCADFLDLKPVQQFDRVVMNPPYRDRQYARHVLHALKFLLPGGRLAAVVPANWRDGNELLELAFDEHGISETELPAAAFRASGTDIKTVILLMEVKK